MLTIAVYCPAQQFGANPASLKWVQVNTNAARIIYPSGLDSSARRAAAIIKYLNEHTSQTAGDAHRKINVVMQNQTIVSNGYVGLAPWRSEFYLTPTFNNFQLGSLPWVDNLAIHEYRHVQQYMNYRKGLSKIAYFVLGEEGQAVANSAAIPNWFFEGDAVFQETLVSAQGRGRLPYFFNPYRSLWQAGRKYSYMKLRNGSLKSFVPDHYALGYLLSGYGREQYGNDFWKKVTGDAAGFKGLFYPFQRALKKYSGISYNDFVQHAVEFYKSQAALSSTSTFLTQGNTHYVSNYVVPQFASNDSLIVLKRTNRTNPGWYWLTKNGEQKIAPKDISQDDYYVYRNGKIVYTAIEPDIRWSQRNYSVIKILDVHSKAIHQVTHKSKYFTPDISADGKQIVAVQFLPDQSTALDILDANSGKVLQKVPASGDAAGFSYPKFYDSSNIIVSVRNKTGMMNIAKINTVTMETDYLLPWSYEVNGFSFIKNDTVYFSASKGYYDDIFAVVISSKNIFKLTHESLGAYQPTVNDKGRLVWSSFTADGFQLKEKTLQAGDWEPVISTATVNADNLFLPNALTHTGANILEQIPAASFPTSKYNKLTSPFNFHSWRPYYEQPEWSFNVYGQNILNTFQSNLYYIYNENEASHKIGFGGTYGALFPWISGGISYTFDRTASDVKRTITWNETNANIGLSVPLNLSKGKWYNFLTAASTFNVEKVNFTGRYKDSLVSPVFNYAEFSLNWTSQVQSAVQHINPRFAQAFYIRYRTILNKYTGNQFFASGNLYFPGIGLNHSIVLSGAYQARDTMEQYSFSNSFPFSRGYDAYEAPRMWKASANYHLPLCYPDWGFGQIVYFLRIRANAFFDYTQLKSLRTANLFTFRSTGAEIYFDTKWWNQQPVSFGVRYSYLFDYELAGMGSANRWQFILPVNLFSH
ncbi:MAG: hypothetical protein QM802_25945 [Agriterribacter sp.]